MDTFASLSWLLYLLPILAPAAEVGVCVTLLYALTRLRIRVTSERVMLVGPDAWSMMCCLFGGMLVTAVMAAVFGLIAALVAAAVSSLAIYGCRLELRVGVEGSTLSRRVIGIIPWSVWHSSVAPQLYVDGWGDMMDPEALHIDFGPTLTHELAWGGAQSGDRAAELAEEFNGAVRRLHEESLRRAVGEALYRSKGV